MRWPRLAGPVVLTTLLSYLLFKTDLYAFARAAVFSQSPWLATFARAGWTPDFHASFASALAQGLLTFFTGQTKYNTNLWTMKYEFVGSVFVFITAAFIVHVLRYRFLLLAFLMLIAILSPLSPRVAPFVFGVFLAAHLSRNQHAVHGVATFWVWVIAGLYCLGYVESVGAYSWLAPVSGGSVENAQILLHTLGSVLIIYGTMRCRSAFAVMSRPFGAWLGLLSFPVYLVHTLVICSIGSSAFVYGHEHGFSLRLAIGVAFAATVLGTLALAVPLMLFDEWWMKRVDQGVRALIRM
jgi:peptidoglycan/LPS O-acetylase OafA/YrhL